MNEAGDEEHNPFSQWQNLERSKEDELQQKAVKRQTARQAQLVGFHLFLSFTNGLERGHRAVGGKSNATIRCRSARELRCRFRR